LMYQLIIIKEEKLYQTVAASQRLQPAIILRNRMAGGGPPSAEATAPKSFPTYTLLPIISSVIWSNLSITISACFRDCPEPVCRPMASMPAAFAA